jgi:hypothetical protein
MTRGLALLADRAQLVACSSEATAADAVDAGFDAARLRVIPLGVNASPQDPPPSPPYAAATRWSGRM